MLIVIGICYLASAGGLSYIGVWVFNTYEHFDEIADSNLTLIPASIIIGVSVFMCIIGILSCMAAFKKSKLLLAVFFCLVLLIFIGEVVAAVLGYVYRSKAEDILRDDLQDAIDQYNVTAYKDQINYLQSEFHCCGVNNASDWLTSTYWSIHHNDTVPQSCCRVNINKTCSGKLDNSTIYTEGCLDKLNDEFRKNLIYIAVTVICLAAIQILALMSSCVLICRTKEETPYQILGEPIGGGLRV